MIDTAQSLAPADAQSVRELAAAATAADGVAPLSEQSLLRLGDDSGGARHFLLRAGGGISGYAQLESDGSAELLVDPARRGQGLGRELATALAARQEPSSLRIWAHGDGAGARALAVRLGYERSRVLLQLRRDLNGALPEAVWPAGVTVRTFEPGNDEAAWLTVNAAAFASHPEQGRWRIADLEQREQQDWFDPKGFFLAERGGDLVGFHWTKVHRDETPPIGEVYVVGVLPAAGGQGLGRALTLVGLAHLQSSDLHSVLLYVDESNVAAMKTYEKLGFTRWATDVMYSLPG
ncbi:MAG TPA: mycothiol synthase [Frankiaceae bacterium]|nr:mycothiol synthase [Frankiaceae bacterium]